MKTDLFFSNPTEVESECLVVVVLDRGEKDKTEAYVASGDNALQAADRELGEIARRVQRSVPVVLAAERQLVAHQQLRLLEIARRGSRDASRALDGVEARVRALDPRRVLERGYTITRTKDGRIVRSAAAVTSGDVVVTETGVGMVQSRVESISDATGEDDT